MPDLYKQLNKLSKKRVLEIMHDTLDILEGYTNKNTINSCLEKAIKTKKSNLVK